jgi:putative phage-type endonuclease
MAETTALQVGSKEWLEERRSGIGGSDAAAVLGISRYASPMKVYLEKTGELEPFAGNEYTEWGNILEPVIREQFQQRTGFVVEENLELLRSEKHPFMVAHLDGIIYCEKEKTPGVLEIKNVSEWKKDEWQNGEAPAEYLVQIQHNMEVTDFRWGYLVALIGGNHLEMLRVERDENLIRQIVEAEREFWNENIIKRVPPAFGASDEDILKALYPQAEEKKCITLPPSLDVLLDERDTLKLRIKELESQLETIENMLKGELGEAEKGVTQYHEVRWPNVYRLNEKQLLQEHPELESIYQVTSFDSKAFKKDNPELAAKYSEPAYRKFDVKELKV